MQMVLNLLSNAVKFSHRSGIVDITLKEGKDTLSITVKDQGIGIPANKLANITLPFEQAESHYTREYEGTGLGLSITKELSEIHGGNLSIESKLGAGTSVTIKLPYKAKK
jgi:two-component system cell cycle sensor histidine kinase PleC